MTTSLLKPISRPAGFDFFRHVYLNHTLALAVLLAISTPAVAHAQDNYEIRVYGHDLIEPKHTMLDLHSNFTTAGLDYYG